MKLQLLLEAYIELNKINAEPGDKCHMLASSIDFIKRQIIGELKRQTPAEFNYSFCETNTTEEKSK